MHIHLADVIKRIEAVLFIPIGATATEWTKLRDEFKAELAAAEAKAKELEKDVEDAV